MKKPSGTMHTCRDVLPVNQREQSEIGKSRTRSATKPDFDEREKNTLSKRKSPGPESEQRVRRSSLDPSQGALVNPPITPSVDMPATSDDSDS